jgi:hypothetical protein
VCWLVLKRLFGEFGSRSKITLLYHFIPSERKETLDVSVLGFCLCVVQKGRKSRKSKKKKEKSLCG